MSTCLRCGSTEGITKDHIIPRSILRKNRVQHSPGVNEQALCEPCNTWKGSHVLVDYRPDREDHERLLRWMRRWGIGGLEVLWKPVQQTD